MFSVHSPGIAPSLLALSRPSFDGIDFMLFEGVELLSLPSNYL